MMLPKLILGDCHSDNRGNIKYNNEFNTQAVKRIYTIENNSIQFIRRWQGHRVEQRWFTAIKGEFKIETIKIDNWKNPSKDLKSLSFKLTENTLDFLHIPQGNVTSIQAISEGAKLLVMSDYSLNEINDEYKLSSDYFNN